ncbi:substrate-binding domain-containing protein [Ruoffia tabacinasalis]|uniref:Extracellular solute-binding protein n=1 Tax=Ruoffia tabacinasalis TaxID=87458 RepID=A0ABS0LKX4_9LACT|nr:substrate-binding domain-containing protein [Ruoffia tabacinasalis]MBG9978784.1 extracellular solute-binding protein [Ruoffia tabacinasalis]
MKKTLKALPLLATAGLVLSSVVPAFAQEGTINVVSREDGSGTRGAFVEIVGVVDENEDDMTTTSAAIQNSTNGVMQTVAGDPNAIGYISLGSLDDTVKSVTVDGAEATPEAINAGDYPIARPFVVAWGEDQSDVSADFLTFIHSQEGQTIVEEEGYIAVDASASAEGEESSEEASSEETTEESATEETTEEPAEGEESAGAEEAASEEETTEEETTEEEASSEETIEEESATEEESTEEESGSVVASLPSYEAAGLEGTVEVVGSTSVTPVMEVLAEEYMALNPDVTINITSNGSSAGIEAATGGAADLGMSSRELTEDEAAALNQANIALDGIAVVVHPESTVEDLSLETIRSIFLGEVTEWEEAAQ